MNLVDLMVVEEVVGCGGSRGEGARRRVKRRWRFRQAEVATNQSEAAAMRRLGKRGFESTTITGSAAIVVVVVELPIWRGCRRCRSVVVVTLSWLGGLQHVCILV